MQIAFSVKNLVASLENIRDSKDGMCFCSPNLSIMKYDAETLSALLDEYCGKADFVYHLAGVNRAEDSDKLMTGNFGFTSTLIETLKKHKNKCSVLSLSSIQAELDYPYGKSKKACEGLMFSCSEGTGAKAIVYRLPNVFEKWCQPNYNSAVATFCFNIANDLPISVNDQAVNMNLAYIDDVVNEFICVLQEKEHDEKTTVLFRLCIK